ncbi:hypothetical protein chiPu_0018886 [Chiloscyllium punctatum]|uniref:Phosphoinositide phospholipase C n=1 Tax=Chiloscyllium punctatum TaxID=137246 RepID=A0A401RQ59_CHIPU|nr:hypothetical protein [Chiloscyllium punctatum]
MADYCRIIFGDMLLTDTMEKYPLRPGVPLPSPHELMGKILIKNKKNKMSSANNQDGQRRKSMVSEADQTTLQGEIPQTGEPIEEHCDIEDEPENMEQEEAEDLKKQESDEGTAGQEVTAYEEMSSLVNYIQPVKFQSFEVAKKINKSYIISSFTETKALDLLVKFSVDFVEYNKRQMSRIYPKGTRVDSSNYMPQVFWNAGCQMVALNFQTADLPMQLNNSYFEFNGRSGYILKHELLRHLDKTFDPFTTDRIDVVVSNTLSILVTVTFFVEVELLGLPGDPKRKYRTKLSTEPNSINPQWKDEEKFVFEKILVPEMAYVRIATFEDNGRFVGHRILPVPALQTGYRHINLRSETNQPLTMPALFVHMEVKDFVPDTWADLTKALIDPIEFVGSMNPPSKQEETVSCDQVVTDNTQTPDNSNGAPDTNGPGTPNILCTGTEESSKDIAEIEPLTIDELKTQKAFLKVQKKQEKDIKELERKIQKKKDDLIQKYSSSFTELRRKNSGNSKGHKKKCLKESYESEMKEMKKKIELKRQEKIENMLKSTVDKSIQEKKTYVKKANILLAEASLKTFTVWYSISYIVPVQYQQEVQDEYEAKMTALPQLVEELSKLIITSKFTPELERMQSQEKDVEESKALEPLPPTTESTSESIANEDEDGPEYLIAVL